MKLLILFILSTATLFAQSYTPEEMQKFCTQGVYLVGSGKYDITGESFKLGMMGYSQLNQTTKGIHTRLYSRSVFIFDFCNGKPIVITVADLGQVFSSIKQEVVKKLKNDDQESALSLTDENFLLSATHTHGGPGGYSHHAIFNLSVLGFDPQNYTTITNGIYESIQLAKKSATLAKIHFTKAKIDNIEEIITNRSAKAYDNNSALLKSKYETNVDQWFYLLKFTDLKNSNLIAVSTWFGIHGTSIDNKNRLITADNKGLSSSFLEKFINKKQGTKNFVAQFAQGLEGDVSPNVYGGENGRGDDQFISLYESAKKQSDFAYALTEDTESEFYREIKGSIDAKINFKNFSKIKVNSIYNHLNDDNKRTCHPTIGLSMLAGAEDGPSNIPLIMEGMVRQGLSHSHIDAELINCHAEKIIALGTGTLGGVHFTAEVLPLQAIKLGSILILGLPYESTTMSGRIMREFFTTKYAKYFDDVILNSMSNEYVGYVTTREEYALQNYEGGFTQFGPWSLNAFMQEFDFVIKNLVEEKKIEPDDTPSYLGDKQIKSLRLSQLSWHFLPLFVDNGDIKRDVEKEYELGEEVVVKFWGKDPNKFLFTGGSYFQIQRLVNETEWIDYKTDNDFDTFLEWSESFFLKSISAKIVWKTGFDNDNERGIYRFKFNTGSDDKYTTSSTFIIH